MLKFLRDNAGWLAVVATVVVALTGGAYALGFNQGRQDYAVLKGEVELGRHLSAAELGNLAELLAERATALRLSESERSELSTLREESTRLTQQMESIGRELQAAQALSVANGVGSIIQVSNGEEGTRRVMGKILAVEDVYNGGVALRFEGAYSNVRVGEFLNIDQRCRLVVSSIAQRGDGAADNVATLTVECRR